MYDASTDPVNDGEQKEEEKCHGEGERYARREKEKKHKAKHGDRIMNEQSPKDRNPFDAHQKPRRRHAKTEGEKQKVRQR